jgi:hypothetical protein
MLNNHILSKGFKLYSLKHQYSLSGNNVIREYLALAYTEKENSVERPILLYYNETTNEYKVTTFHNNPKISEEYLSMGEVTTKDELDNVIDNLYFSIKEINLQDLNKYE